MLRSKVRPVPHRSGKSFAQYMSFIEAVKSGKRAIVVAKDYVVLSRKTFESNERLRVEIQELKGRIGWLQLQNQAARHKIEQLTQECEGLPAGKEGG